MKDVLIVENLNNKLKSIGGNIMGYYGEVNFKGEKYNVTCEAFIDNIGTDGECVYYAYAEKDGKKYRVMWRTLEEFDLAGELLSLEERLNDLDGRQYTEEGMEQEKRIITDRIKELEDQGINSVMCEDGSNACDWDNADNVEEIDD
jgi:hypothetical protein